MKQGRSYGVATIFKGWEAISHCRVFVGMGHFQAYEIAAGGMMEGPLGIASGSGSTLSNVPTVVPRTGDPVPAEVCSK
jgi:hypothetical protein